MYAIIRALLCLIEQGKKEKHTAEKSCQTSAICSSQCSGANPGGEQGRQPLFLLLYSML